LCGAKAPKEGIPEKFIAHSYEEEQAIDATFDNDEVDGSWQAYCAIVNAR